MISAWLTCLEALDLTKERDDLIEEARKHMLANANCRAASTCTL